MNQIVPGEGEVRGLTTIGHISYLLHALVALGAVVPGLQVSVALLLVAFIIDLVKKPDAAGTWQESHFKWRIRSVLWAAALYALTLPLFVFVLPGLLAWIGISIWFLYRIVRGWMNMNDHRPMPQ